jgi:hypothetical protein
LIKENHGLHEGDAIAEHLIPTTFNEETEYLSDPLKIIWICLPKTIVRDYMKGTKRSFW